MTKLLLVLLASLASLPCIAAEPKCAYPNQTVKQLAVQNTTDIVHYIWDTGRDKRSNEHLKTLRLLFKNGDYAVIQHKYCSMYNFEVAYFRNGQLDNLDEASIGKIVGSLYDAYAAKKATFKRPLADIVASSLRERGFGNDKDVRIGLPEGGAEYPNEVVEYSIRYRSLYRNTNTYSGVATFYIGIGGLS